MRNSYKKITKDLSLPTVSCRIVIQGIVQGVGFRPFVYRLANSYSIVGFVLNNVSDVLIEAQGTTKDVDSFIQALPVEKPPNALITSLQVEHREEIIQKSFSSFSIKTSAQTGTRTIIVPPDTDICSDCLTELLTPGNRRYLYPFINCTNCGPRYTIIKDLPYDRPKTSMDSFDLCPLCASEYHDPNNRRFHAQPNACSDCGPQLFLTDNCGLTMTDDPIKNSCDLLADGKILAIKGIGGFHLVVNASDQQAVGRLRDVKNRPDKPLAIMSKDIGTIRKFASISPHEKELLTGITKPIVLLEKTTNFLLAENIAPNIRYIGTMLPYSPLHHLLFQNNYFSSLVMTSGNMAGEPIIIDNDEAKSKLSKSVDYFLFHNRTILTSNDDSVVKSEANKTVFIRRSRSYAPVPIHLPFESGSTLALGGAIKNTICLTKGSKYYLSQHIGNLHQYESIKHFESVIKHLSKLLQISPNLVVHDLHPDAPSLGYAKRSSLPTIGVQHHHAHAVSCMAENNLNEPVLAITLDGSGYGSDGTIWGGEILVAEHTSFKRIAHLQQFQLPGGDKAAMQPWRTAVSCLHQILGDEIFNQDLPFIKLHKKELPTIITMLTQDINSPQTSSCGRLFDCIAALLDVRQYSTYEGQAATELEMSISSTDKSFYSFEIIKDNDEPWQLSWKPMLTDILSDLSRNSDISLISSRFHNTLVQILAAACKAFRDIKGLNKIVLSGGVFQNNTFNRNLISTLEKADFQVFSHHQVPSNDGGLSLGQAVAGPQMYNAA